jgi:hypothetical protein
VGVSWVALALDRTAFLNTWNFSASQKLKFPRLLNGHIFKGFIIYYLLLLPEYLMPVKDV